jgi:hypothetical protein
MYYHIIHISISIKRYNYLFQKNCQFKFLSICGLYVSRNLYKLVSLTSNVLIQINYNLKIQEEK